MDEIEAISATFDQLFNEDWEVTQILSRPAKFTPKSRSINRSQTSSFKATTFKHLKQVVDFLAPKLPQWEELKHQLNQLSPSSTPKKPRISRRLIPKQLTLTRVSFSTTRNPPEYSPSHKQEYLNLLETPTKQEINQRIRINKAGVHKFLPVQYQNYLRLKKERAQSASQEAQRSKKLQQETTKLAKINKLVGKTRKFRIRTSHGMLDSTHKACLRYLVSAAVVCTLKTLVFRAKQKEAHT